MTIGLATLVVLGLGARARADACVVRTESANIPGVEVAIVGGAPIMLDVRGADSVAIDVPARADQSVHAHVVSSLELDGRALARAVPWDWAEGGVSIAGVLFVEPGSRWSIARAWADDKHVHVTVVRPGARIEDAVVTCASIALENHRAEPPADAESADVTSASAFWAPSVRTLRMRRGSSGPTDLTLSLSTPATFLLELVREQPAVALVRQHGPGYTLEGWVARREIRPAPIVHSTLGFSSRSVGVPRCDPAEDPDVWTGAGAVIVGTAVVDRPGGVAWARIATTRALSVSYRVGSAWAAIHAAPGLVFPPGWCRAPRAWVPASAVSFGVAHGPTIPLSRAIPSNAAMRVSPRALRHVHRAPPPPRRLLERPRPE